MKDIKIIPVFNQTPVIQQTLAHIEAVTYNFYFKDYRSIECIEDEALSYFARSVKNGRDNYAFAAFNDNKIIGFISGNGNLINNLFILPEYSGQGIGTELLNYAELINHNFNKNIHLNSLSTGIKFYKKYGYTQDNFSNIFRKNLHFKTDYDYIIPFFNAKYKLEKYYNIKTDDLNNKQVCFAHIRNNNLLGYIKIENGKLISNTISSCDKSAYFKLHSVISEYNKTFEELKFLLKNLHQKTL